VSSKPYLREIEAEGLYKRERIVITSQQFSPRSDGLYASSPRSN
jgi:hypothetical protein